MAVVQTKDVREGEGVDWSSLLRTEPPGKKKPDLLRAGDLLFVAKGARFYAVALNEVPFAAVPSPHFFHMRLRPGVKALPEFIAWLLNSASIQRELTKAAAGVTQHVLRKPVLESLAIEWPPIDKQTRITALLAAARAERRVLEKLIDNRRRQLDAIAAAIPCHLAEPAHE